MTIFESIRNEYVDPANHDLYRIWIIIGIAIAIFLWCRFWFRLLDGAILERKALKIEGSVYVCDWIEKERFDKEIAVCKVRSIERASNKEKMFKI